MEAVTADAVVEEVDVRACVLACVLACVCACVLACVLACLESMLVGRPRRGSVGSANAGDALRRGFGTYRTPSRYTCTSVLNVLVDLNDELAESRPFVWVGPWKR